MKHLINEKTKSILTPKNIGLYILGNAFISLGPVIASASGLGACGYDAYNFRLAEILHVNTSVVVYMSAFICLVIGAVIRKSHLHYFHSIINLRCGLRPLANRLRKSCTRKRYCQVHNIRSRNECFRIRNCSLHDFGLAEQSYR